MRHRESGRPALSVLGLWLLLFASLATAAEATTGAPVRRGASTRAFDFDGDRRADLLAVESDGSHAVVRVGLASGAPPALLTSEVPSADAVVLVVDVDADEDLDVVIGSSSPVNAPGVWINDGRGHFTPPGIGSRSRTAGTDRPLREVAVHASAEGRTGDPALCPDTTARVDRELRGGRAESRVAGRAHRPEIEAASPRGPPL